MKHLFLILALLFSTSLPAQAPVAVPLPKEPHHHLVLENDYVRVFRVSLPAHAATLLHQHDVPYLYVSLGPADVVNAVQGRPEARIVMADGQVGYSPGHFAHIARTDAGSTFDNVTIELLHPQGEPRNDCEKIIPGEVGSCDLSHAAPSGPIVIRPLMETDEVDVESFDIKQGKIIDNSHSLPGLLVNVGAAPVRINYVPGQLGKTLRAGEVVWLAAGAKPEFLVKDFLEAKLLLLTFK
jgi:quercetin dioxygenase-like cupin family protein